MVLKEATVSRSSTKAEYRGIVAVAVELAWFQSLLSELHIFSKPPIIWCDNISAISLSSNFVLHARTRYIEIELFFCLGESYLWSAASLVCAIFGAVSSFSHQTTASYQILFVEKQAQSCKSLLRLRGRNNTLVDSMFLTDDQITSSVMVKVVRVC